MSQLKAFDHERLMLAHALVYGENALKHVLPQLSHEKFLFSKEGMFGSTPDHMRIWQAITLCYLKDKMSPDVPKVMSYLSGNEDYRPYLISLCDQLTGYYRVRELDVRFLTGLMNTIDRNGIAFRTASKGEKLGQIIETVDAFDSYVNSIQDIDAWMNDQMSGFREVVRPQTEGYKHISETMASTRELWERVRRGEHTTLLPVGMPSLASRGLFPVGKLVVVQGESNNGKSAFVHLVNLGTAVGLTANNIKGCVLINSLEEDADALNTKLAGILAGVNTYNFLMFNEITHEEYQRLCYWSEFVSKLPLYVDHTNFLKTSVQEFRVNGIHSSERGPVWQMSSDYLELFDPSDSGISDSKERQLDYVIHQHFRTSREVGCSVIDISQVTQGNGINKHRIAGADGTRYSKAIRHAADIIVEILNYGELKRSGIDAQPPEGMNDTDVFGVIEKYRNGPKGEPFRLNWEREFVRMSDPDLRFGKADDEWRLFDHLETAERLLYDHNRLMQEEGF